MRQTIPPVRQRPSYPALQQPCAELGRRAVQNPHQRTFRSIVGFVTIYFTGQTHGLATVFEQPRYRHGQIRKGITIQQHMRSCREFVEEFSFQECIRNTKS